MPKLPPEERAKPFYVDVVDVAEEAESIVVQSYHTTEALRRMRGQAEAKRILRSETRPQIPTFKRLDAFLEEPDEETRYRIDELWPSGGNVLISAQYKAGKTTLVHNVISSLVDGRPFLGRFKTTPVTGRVVVLDFEMPEGEARRWLRNTGIVRAEAVMYAGMRGQAAAFDVTDQECREEWSVQLRAVECEVLVVDCLAPIAAALGLDEKNDADMGPLLQGLNALAAAAGVAELFLIHHMGHSHERARGASGLLGWPDALWKVVRPGDDPAGPRYFSAFGRSVDVPEGALVFDEQSRCLSLADGGRSRRQAGGKSGTDIDSYVQQLVAAGVPDFGREQLKAWAANHGIALPGNTGMLSQITKAVRAWRKSERLPEPE
ncbi:AAA family ATPase [Streptomyces yerevanensis]|uniref:AAA family ATPase n=1 Tax=Streptomyces yerevanensis TaxID=66378 RepID=UPI000524876A|nr:AAA family ATPase [Streptomyces yerevanensis]